MHARMLPLPESGAASDPDPQQVLARVDLPDSSIETRFASGRRCELESDGETDRITVRARDGAVVLRVSLTDAGPVLSFSAAEVTIEASRRLTLDAPEITLHAEDDVTLDVGGSMRARIAGDHHTRVGGKEQLEASAIELQASRAAVAVRAMEAITLDGEHIGLNDDPCPCAFPWSEIAGEISDG